MSIFVARYPDRKNGIALLLLRFSGAMVGFGLLSDDFAGGFHRLLTAAITVAIASALIAGMRTRLAAILLILLIFSRSGADIIEVNLAVMAHFGIGAALGLLGPGASSLDARIFGRRVISVETRRPDRGNRN
jgi:hypothetical protein